MHHILEECLGDMRDFAERYFAVAVMVKDPIDAFPESNSCLPRRKLGVKGRKRARSKEEGPGTWAKVSLDSHLLEFPFFLLLCDPILEPFATTGDCSDHVLPFLQTPRTLRLTSLDSWCSGAIFLLDSILQSDLAFASSS